MYGYVDDYEPKCFGCDYHEVVMCDADMNASYCNNGKCYCSCVVSCKKWDESKQLKSKKS